MLLEASVVAVGEIASEVHAPAFLTPLGGGGYEQADREHVLALPAFGRIEDFVHHVSLPEPDNFLRLRQRLRSASDAHVSPHQGPQ